MGLNFSVHELVTSSETPPGSMSISDELGVDRDVSGTQAHLRVRCLLRRLRRPWACRSPQQGKHNHAHVMSTTALHTIYYQHEISRPAARRIRVCTRASVCVGVGRCYQTGSLETSSDPCIDLSTSGPSCKVYSD